MQKLDLNIRSKLVIILSVFVVVSTGAVAYSLLNIKGQKSDALIINLAGRQRALVQAISKSVLGLHNAAEDGDTAERARRTEFYQKDILDKRKLFNETLAALMDGGAVTDGDSSLVTVPRTRDLALRVKLEESKALWESFAARLDLVLAGFKNTKDKEVNAAIRYIEENNTALFKDMNKLTMMFQAASDTKLRYFKNILYIGIG